MTLRFKPLWSLIFVVGLLVGAFAPMAMASAQDTEVPREEILKIAIPGPIQDPSNMNFIMSGGASRSDTGLHQLAYEYFFYSNLQTGEFIPWLATDYSYNEDSSAITVNLREGVTWNDGEPFTAADVVFTYDLMRETPSLSFAPEASAAVASVEAVDDLTVVFNLTTPNPRFHLYREGFPAVGIWGAVTILPQHIWEGQDATTFLNSPPVGTGPYRLKEATQSAVVWERRDDWWGTSVFGRTPGPREVQFLHLGAETNVALALSNNEIDSSNIGILSAGSFQEIAVRNDAVAAWSTDLPFAWSDPCPRALMVQNATAPLDQPAVRQAISHLINRESIVDLAYEGVTTPAWSIFPEYDSNTPYFEAVADVREANPIETFDEDRAAELFTEAGVDPGSLTLRYLVNADSNEEVRVAAIIADQLDAAGINVEVQPLSGSAQADARRAGDYELALQAFCPGYIVENLDLFTSKNFRPLGEQAPWFERNSFRYQNPALDTLVEQMFALNPDDTAALTPLFHDAMEIWMADLPVIPIVQAPALVPFNSTYWTGWPTADDPWNMPVSWWSTFNLVLNGYPNPETGEWVGGITAAGGE